MYVESFDRFAEVGDFDAESGALNTFDRSSGEGEGRLVEGHFATLSGTPVVFYRHRGDLWLRVRDRAWRLADPSTVHWSATDDSSRLAVMESGREVAHVEYETDRKDPDDLTAFGTDEDWDFGLFVSNVLHDQGRRQRIYSESAGDE
jgi:hypothetical protein